MKTWLDSISNARYPPAVARYPSVRACQLATLKNFFLFFSLKEACRRLAQFRASNGLLLFLLGGPTWLVSASCARAGTDDRHDPAHDTEHVVMFPWKHAEALAWECQKAQEVTSASGAMGAMGATTEVSGPPREVGARGGHLYIDPSALTLPQAPPPLSPLAPPASCEQRLPARGKQISGSKSSDGVSAPPWRRKVKR